VFSPSCKQHARSAIVVPDNVLFEGGAGETVRRELLKDLEDSANLPPQDVIAAEIDSLVPTRLPFGLARPCRPLP